MPLKPKTACPQPGCPALTSGDRYCEDHRRPRRPDTERPSFRQRGYGYQHDHRFRPGVLRRDPKCVLCRRRPSRVADHYPLSRRELVAQGLDPNDPAHGRGLCDSCHSGIAQAELHRARKSGRY